MKRREGDSDLDLMRLKVSEREERFYTISMVGSWKTRQVYSMVEMSEVCGGELYFGNEGG
jgi:hypothetical protein